MAMEVCSTTLGLRLKSLFLLFLLSCVVAVAQEEDGSISVMEEAEQEALYAVIRSLAGRWFNGSELYPDPCGWTPIQGVSCDLFGGFWYATTINIGGGHDGALDCSDDAAFDSRLFELKHLKSLSFYRCFRRPTIIPDGNWTTMSHSLEVLEFRSNPGLIGKMPARFGYMRKLQSLVLVENNMTGKLPELGGLTELRQLVLAGNRFDGEIPVGCGGLRNLLIMDLSRNALSGSLPSSLGRLVSLLKLDLSNNSFEGAIPIELGELKNLTLLDLRNNQFSNGLPLSVQEMASLEEMLLANNPIAGELVGIEWNKLENLIILDLSNTVLVGGIPESITGMQRLRFLALNGNNLSGNVPAKLENMPDINTIHLNGNNLAGQLQFSEGFYRKLGRHFVVWDNPKLCYNGPGNGLSGVTQCTELQHDEIPSSKSGAKALNYVLLSDSVANRASLSKMVAAIILLGFLMF